MGKANQNLSSVEVHSKKLLLILYTIVHFKIGIFHLVYNEEDNHSFCHHEVLINSYPLALEWLDYDPDQPDVKGTL